MTHMRGAALVLVLWLVFLLTGLVSTYALTARVEAMRGRVAVERMMAAEQAHAGVDWIVSRIGLLDAQGTPLVVADGRTQTWTFDKHTLEIAVQSEAGKVDVNAADPVLLTALMLQLGVDADQASGLGAAIADWRDTDDLARPGGAEAAHYQQAGLPYGPADRPFARLEDVRRVLGMDATLLEPLLPHITVWSRQARPDVAAASPVVLRAMGLDPQMLATQRAAGIQGADADGAYAVRCHVILDEHRRWTLNAVVRLERPGNSQAAYTVLQWQQGMERT